MGNWLAGFVSDDHAQRRLTDLLDTLGSSAAPGSVRLHARIGDLGNGQIGERDSLAEILDDEATNCELLRREAQPKVDVRLARRVALAGDERDVDLLPFAPSAHLEAYRLGPGFAPELEHELGLAFAALLTR